MDGLDKRSVTSAVNGMNGGVKTFEGKSVSKHNSFKHGIFANYSTSFDDITFEDAYTQFAEEFGDHTPSRKALISQLAILHIRLRRCSRFESEFIREHLNPPKFEKRLVRAGFELDLGPMEDEYESVMIDPGEPMTLNPLVLSDLDNVYSKYEAQFLSRFCHIVEILTRSAK